MEQTQSGEEQTEEQEKCTPAASDGAASVTVAPAGTLVETGKESIEMKETQQKAPGTALEEGMAKPEKAQRDREEDSMEESYVIESSPEKQPSEHTKEESMKSLGEDVYSIDDEEEPEDRPGEVEDEEENEEVEEEEMYGDMDEDEEIYVETTDRVDTNELSDDENSSESAISSDEYTDDEEKIEKTLPAVGKRKLSPVEDDDEDVQILTDDDDEMEEEEDHESDEDEEEEEVEDEEMDTTPELDTMVIRKYGPKYDSDGSGSFVEKCQSMKVKYRNYQRKVAAVLRKRSIKILNKRSMHVMEDSSDALVVCSDANLSTVLKPAQVSPKQQSPEEELPVTKVPEKPETIVQTSNISTTITSSSSSSSGCTPKVDGSQSKTKEPADHPVATGGSDKRREHEDKEAESKAEAISSSSDKMPTATAIEVPEKIADSSDDALSVLASKKSISSAAASSPTVNSCSVSAEPGEGQAKESNADTTHQEMVEPNDGKGEENMDEHHQQPQQQQQSEEGLEEVAALPPPPPPSSKSPTAVEENAEPTVDDVMEGIDDFMDHNGSEGKEENGGDFNEDLTFQMDVEVVPPTVVVDPPTIGTIGNERKVEEAKPDKTTDRAKEGTEEESAMDLTSSSDPQPSQRDGPSVGLKEKQAVTGTIQSSSPVVVISDVVDSSPRMDNQQRSSVTARESEVNMRDKTIITSTPIASSGSDKRTESVSSAAVQQNNSEQVVTQVKREVTDGGHVEERDDRHHEEGGVQNLSTSKPSAAEATNHAQATSRKRRRSIDRDDRTQAGAEQEEGEVIEPAKKLKLEVEANYQAHERVVNEYIDTTPNTSVDEIQRHADMLVKEIQNLNDMIRDTEQKWNNLLHLKKVKEEVLLRLNRRKHVIGITETRLGEVSAFSHLDSSNLSSHQQLNHTHQRSSSVGPRPPTPPPEVEIRPASVSTTTASNYNHSASNGIGSAGGSKHSQISNRRNSSIAGGSGGHGSNSSATGNKRNTSSRDTNSFVSQFNSSNNAVTMVPLPNPTNMILQARANMNAAEIAKEKAIALQVQRQLFPKPVLSNQQQILNNLAMSAGLTSLAAGGSGGGANSGGNSTAHLNGHHGPSLATSGATSREQQQQLQIGRQGMRKDVSSIIADYRQKHPENVPRRGRRLKHIGGSNNGGAGNATGNSFGEGGAISLTALPGGKSPAMGSAARSSSTDSVANRLSELLAAAENSRPSSNDSSQSSSNLLSSLVSASGTTAGGSGGNSQQQFLKDVLIQFAKMSQNEQSLLSNLQLLANNAVLASTGPNTATTNTVSSPQQSPQFQQQQHQQQTLPQLQASLLSKASLPEVTLHPVMNSTAHSDIFGSHNSSGATLAGANLSAVNSSSNSLLHGILTKSASRPASGAAAAAAAVNNFNSFSPTLARLLTGPERMNAAQSAASSSSATVTSGALANLQTATSGVIGGLNLSKNNNEVSITPIGGPNYHQTHQQQQQLQRLRDQHLFKGESYLNIDDEADDSVDRLVIDEGDELLSHRDALSKRRVAEVNENEVPQCQGCKKMEAKFVCAGCNHQWYCSRECQVNAWDDHSEVCSG